MEERGNAYSASLDEMLSEIDEYSYSILELFDIYNSKVSDIPPLNADDKWLYFRLGLLKEDLSSHYGLTTYEKYIINTINELPFNPNNVSDIRISNVVTLLINAHDHNVLNRKSGIYKTWYYSKTYKNIPTSNRILQILIPHRPIGEYESVNYEEFRFLRWLHTFWSRRKEDGTAFRILKYLKLIDAIYYRK